MWRERLQGLGLLVLGLGCLVLIGLLQQVPWFNFRPPGLPGAMAPAISPLWCILLPMAVGALSLCALGLKKILLPDTWRPPKHLG